MPKRQPVPKKAIPSSQPENRNYLIPNSFQFSIERTPTVGFFGSTINVPGMTLGVTNQPTGGLKNIARPGEIIEFADLDLTFFVDEDMQNYLEIDKWIRGLGFPESLKQIYDLQAEGGHGTNTIDIFSDATLQINNNQMEPAFSVTFEGLFPFYLGPLEFNSQVADVEFLQARVGFKYLIYTIEPGAGSCC